MTEFSIFWTTGTTGDGTNPYTETQLFSWLRRTFNSDLYADRGPLRGFGGELEVTAGTGKVTVATGAAYVYGIPYENDAAQDVTIPTPLANTRIDRVVLRADWSAKTVRITRIAGTEGAGTPAITQNPGSIYDVPLAQVSVTTGGVITVTDERQFCRFATEVDTENIANGAVDTQKLADGTVTTAKIAGGAVTAAKISDGACLTEILDDDGHGSGLDADLLDGQHGSYYAPASKFSDIAQGKSTRQTIYWDVPATTTEVPNSMLSLSLNGQCDVIVLVTLGYSTSASATASIYPALDSYSLESRNFGETAAASNTASMHWFYDSIPSGSHVIKLYATKVSGGTTTIVNFRLSILVIPE